MNELAERLELLLQRIRASYDGLGHSSGRPYVYFVYPPDQERAIRRLVAETLRDEQTLSFHYIDLLPLTIHSLAGQEERREKLLDDSKMRGGASDAVLRLWSRRTSQAIIDAIGNTGAGARPVAVLHGLAALHPLGNPTRLMEGMAEQEVRDPASGRIVPVVLLVPGIRPPQTSRRYWFLGHPGLECDFYRGEEA